MGDEGVLGVMQVEKDHAEFGVPVQAEDATTTTDSGYFTGESRSNTDGQPDGDGRGPDPPDDQHLPQRNILQQLPQVPQQPQQPQVHQRWNPIRDESGGLNLLDFDFPDHHIIEALFEQGN